MYYRVKALKELSEYDIKNGANMEASWHQDVNIKSKIKLCKFYKLINYLVQKFCIYKNIRA